MRCEEINISGGMVRQKAKYERFLRKRSVSNPRHGAVKFRCVRAAAPTHPPTTPGGAAPQQQQQQQQQHRTVQRRGAAPNCGAPHSRACLPLPALFWRFCYIRETLQQHMEQTAAAAAAGDLLQPASSRRGGGTGEWDPAGWSCRLPEQQEGTAARTAVRVEAACGPGEEGMERQAQMQRPPWPYSTTLRPLLQPLSYSSLALHASLLCRRRRLLPTRCGAGRPAGSCGAPCAA